MYTIIKFDVAPSGINVTPEYIAERLKDELSNQLMPPLAENISSTVKNYLDKHTEKFLPSGIYKTIDNKIFKYTIDSNNFSEFSNPNLDAAFEDLYLEHQYLIGYKDIIEKIHKNCTTGYYPNSFITPIHSIEISNHQQYSSGIPIYQFLKMFAFGDILEYLYQQTVKILFNSTDIEVDKYVILTNNSKPISAFSFTDQIKIEITDNTFTRLEDLLKNYLDQIQCKIFINNIKNLLNGVLKFNGLYDKNKYTLYKNLLVIKNNKNNKYKAEILLTPDLIKFFKNLNLDKSNHILKSKRDFLSNEILQELDISHPDSFTAKFKIIKRIDSDRARELCMSEDGKKVKLINSLPTAIRIEAPSGWILLEKIKEGDVVYIF